MYINLEIIVTTFLFVVFFNPYFTLLITFPLLSIINIYLKSREIYTLLSKHFN